MLVRRWEKCPPLCPSTAPQLSLSTHTATFLATRQPSYKVPTRPLPPPNLSLNSRQPRTTDQLLQRQSTTTLSGCRPPWRLRIHTELAVAHAADVPSLLETLPEEIICEIAAHLEFAGLCALRLTSHTMAYKSEFTFRSNYRCRDRFVNLTMEGLEKLHEMSLDPLFSQSITRLYFRHPSSLSELAEKAEFVGNQTSTQTVDPRMALLLSTLGNLKGVKIVELDDNCYGNEGEPWSTLSMRAICIAVKVLRPQLKRMRLHGYCHCQLSKTEDDGEIEETSDWDLEGLEDLQYLCLVCSSVRNTQSPSPNYEVIRQMTCLITAGSKITELDIRVLKYDEDELLGRQLVQMFNSLQNITRFTSLQLMGFTFRSVDILAVLAKLKSLKHLGFFDCILIEAGSWIDVIRFMRNGMDLQGFGFSRNGNPGYTRVKFVWSEPYVYFSKSLLAGDDGWVYVTYYDDDTSIGWSYPSAVKERGIKKVLDDMIAGFTEVED
ncbi:uncharacterized protein K452DRAFT_304379 [Aplosporella prunicola CBS 121167]|uniref:F-box domain-containing protein n=1 Tax=Aplosporella prunicola CBS 121167 TaxID=1176127 RepID=A0A6A6BXV8_9PEZI|nr:uncharacterized protein K452DRAFT_304379 [Aplosporella prunicola CBS 121167]KAF2147571.1 hypothetical protein K452DRAFT_304379 [Aplosporella prunicola CBS 121167]